MRGLQISQLKEFMERRKIGVSMFVGSLPGLTKYQPESESLGDF